LLIMDVQQGIVARFAGEWAAGLRHE